MPCPTAVTSYIIKFARRGKKKKKEKNKKKIRKRKIKKNLQKAKSKSIKPIFSTARIGVAVQTEYRLFPFDHQFSFCRVYVPYEEEEEVQVFPCKEEEEV